MATTEKPFIRIHDVENNIVIDREMNDEEYAQWIADGEAEQARLAEANAQAAAKQAILDRLGLTVDEAKLLLK